MKTWRRLPQQQRTKSPVWPTRPGSPPETLQSQSGTQPEGPLPGQLGPGGAGRTSEGMLGREAADPETPWTHCWDLQEDKTQTESGGVKL